MKNKLTVEQEASILHYIEYGRGKQMKGVQREYMYEIYNMFSNDGRSVSTCTCLDRDTHRKVDNFINKIEWSEETKTSEKMKELLPDSYIEPVPLVQTQPLKIDLEKLSKAIEKRKAKKVPVKPVKKSKVKKK